MCLLCYTAPGNEPNWKGLETACINNPDGFGWAIHHGDHIEVGKSMEYMTALETYYDALHATDMNVHSMFHARWATHGSEDLDNCHPFWVGKTQETVLAHNGVLPVDIPKGDERSDTRYFAEEILPQRSKRVFDKRKSLRKLEKWMGGSKFVVFTTADHYESPVYIVNEELGHWDNDGSWWSNDSYQHTYYSRLYMSGKVGGWDEDDLLMAAYKGAKADDPKRTCSICKSWLTRQEYLVLGVCGTCGVCLECEAWGDDCLCYTPRDLKINLDPEVLNERGYEADDFDYEPEYSQYLKDGGTPIALEFSSNKPYSSEGWTFGTGSSTTPNIDY